MATQDYDAEQADFNRRADLINAALEGADDETAEALLAMFAGRHLSRFIAQDRKLVRRDIIRGIDWVTRGV